jgi:hypothetical protein
MSLVRRRWNSPLPAGARSVASGQMEQRERDLSFERVMIGALVGWMDEALALGISGADGKWRRRRAGLDGRGSEDPIRK